MNNGYLLGIDAGGTKTHALVADLNGRIISGGESGPGNWEGVGLDGAFAAYAQAIDDALRTAGITRSDIIAAGYALAGLDWESDAARLESVIARLELPGPYTLVNDAFGALRAGSADGCGVVVIAGTGSTVAGRNRSGATFRTFGLGARWGDFDGAAGLVWDATRAIGHAWIGRGPATALSDAFVQAYGASDVPDLVERVSRGAAPPPDGRLAPLVFAAADAGDEIACCIVRQAGEELGKTAAAVARKLALEHEAFDVVLAGGVFRARSRLLIDALAEQVRLCAPKARVAPLEAPPVAGSVLLAFDAAGIPTPPTLRARLLDEAQRWFQTIR
ncbi:MAG: BadF/BadG/BcrA/BcrD ATPase family protein [Roseiflexaceae bacterium]|nr:ATPase [Roseiflexus sp.]MDW8213112.1 BadF/BadG/BcrA/BcrD ATPase family protein [Roseiflexaceae bacterium]